MHSGKILGIRASEKIKSFDIMQKLYNYYTRLKLFNTNRFAIKPNMRTENASSDEAGVRTLKFTYYQPTCFVVNVRVQNGKTGYKMRTVAKIPGLTALFGRPSTVSPIQTAEDRAAASGKNVNIMLAAAMSPCTTPTSSTAMSLPATAWRG